jgi:hypothetical protein
MKIWDVFAMRRKVRHNQKKMRVIMKRENKWWKVVDILHYKFFSWSCWVEVKNWDIKLVQ